MQQGALQFVEGSELARVDIGELICGFLDRIELLNKRGLLFKGRKRDDDPSQVTDVDQHERRAVGLRSDLCLHRLRAQSAAGSTRGPG